MSTKNNKKIANKKYSKAIRSLKEEKREKKDSDREDKTILSLNIKHPKNKIDSNEDDLSEKANKSHLELLAKQKKELEKINGKKMAELSEAKDKEVKKEIENKYSLLINELQTKHKKELKKSNEKISALRNKKKYKEIKKLNTSPKGTRIIKNSAPDVLIDVKGVTKSYATKSFVFNALKDVSLEIKKGEFVVILGPSGSGKSTLLNVISGLDRSTYGDIIVDNTNISAITDRELVRFRRKKVGFVFQSYNLLSTLNVNDNVDIGRNLQMDKAKRMQIPELLNKMGMENQGKKRTFELSGGQQQRVAIARALAKSPNLLIGDEPTGALDSKSKIEVFELFKEINKKGTTILIVTHNEQIAKLANKVIRIKDGVIESVIVNKKPASASILG
ncbi:MAG: ATP-binding cassette domain-containing protein [Mycoplasma sp.]|nr:ATP-binding cassette domain-containing protein [Mycoplasma sp.]